MQCNTRKKCCIIIQIKLSNEKQYVHSRAPESHTFTRHVLFLTQSSMSCSQANKKNRVVFKDDGADADVHAVTCALITMMRMCF